MKEKSILDLSIKDICEHAGLSRSTFYTYYRNQYDLLRQIEEQTFIEADKVLQPYRRKIKKTGSREIAVILQDTLQFIANNGDSIQVLLSENGDSDFQKKFLRKGIESFGQFTEANSFKLQDKKDARYGSVFIVGGVLALIQEWLKNGMDIPAPQLARLLTRIIREGLG
jgi:AcrR family transcriptional regulator